MSSAGHPVTFERYRKNVKGLWAPGGVLLAYGYIREFNVEEILNGDAFVPDEISLVCSQFLDLYLGYKSELIKQDKTQKVLTINRAFEWNSMSALDKRLLRDQLVFKSEKHTTQIHCEVKTKQFGEYGAHWIASIVKNCQRLSYLNLSNCYFDDHSVQIVCASIRESQNSSRVMLDISDNYQVSHKSMEHILSIMDRLIGLNLNCTRITDQSCVMLSDYFNENGHILGSLMFLKLNDNSGISESGKAVLRPFESRTCLILD